MKAVVRRRQREDASAFGIVLGTEYNADIRLMLFCEVGICPENELVRALLGKTHKSTRYTFTTVYDEHVITFTEIRILLI